MEPEIKIEPLDPSRISPDAERAAEQIHIDGKIPERPDHYVSAMRYWSGWFELSFGRCLNDAYPLPASVIKQFIVDHVIRVFEPSQENPRNRRLLPDGKSWGTWSLSPEIDHALPRAGLRVKTGPTAFNTLRFRLRAIRAAHSKLGHPGPLNDTEVKQLLASFALENSRHRLAVGINPPLIHHHLEALLATCDDSLQGARDAAILSFGWFSGGRRRSEIALANFKNLKRLSDGSFLYCIKESRWPIAGKAPVYDDKPVDGVAAAALDRWIRLAGLNEDQPAPIFRKIGRVNGKQLVREEQLSPAYIRTLVQRRAEQAGLPTGFSAQSLRSGFIAEGYMRDVPVVDIMDLSGKKTLAPVRKYSDPGRRSPQTKKLLSGRRSMVDNSEPPSHEHSQHLVPDA